MNSNFCPDFMALRAKASNVFTPIATAAARAVNFPLWQYDFPLSHEHMFYQTSYNLSFVIRNKSKLTHKFVNVFGNYLFLSL